MRILEQIVKNTGAKYSIYFLIAGGDWLEKFKIVPMFCSGLDFKGSARCICLRGRAVPMASKKRVRLTSHRSTRIFVRIRALRKPQILILVIAR
jgi:hypothetical protein